jgi:hypothetical protein
MTSLGYQLPLMGFCVSGCVLVASPQQTAGDAGMQRVLQLTHAPQS